jgi:hypothetical protein
MCLRIFLYTTLYRSQFIFRRVATFFFGRAQEGLTEGEHRSEAARDTRLASASPVLRVDPGFSD